MHHAIPFIATISNQPPPLESPFGLSHAGPPRITSSRFPSQSHSSYHVPSFASYVCVVQWNVKRLFYEADIGLHSKLMRMIVPIVQRTSSKHNRKFPPITYSPRSNRFLLRFIPSIFPSLFALASSIYPLGKLGHSGMDLSKWKRNLANGRKEERERDGLTIYRPVIPITRDLQRTESEITGGVEVSVSLKGSPVTASSFRPRRFLSLNLLSCRMYTLSKGEGPSPFHIARGEQRQTIPTVSPLKRRPNKDGGNLIN